MQSQKTPSYLRDQQGASFAPFSTGNKTGGKAEEGAPLLGLHTPTSPTPSYLTYMERRGSDDSGAFVQEYSCWANTKYRLLHPTSTEKMAACILLVLLLILTVTLCITQISSHDSSSSVNLLAHTADLHTQERLLSAHNAYQHAAIASDAHQCSQIGTSLLSRGGSVVDAAVGTLFCIGLHCAHSTGIGGGSLMLIHAHPNDGGERQTIVLDSRETAPLAATWDMFNHTSTTEGYLNIAVPGEVKGYHEIWQRFGRLPWADLVQPAIDMCVNGYKIEPALAQQLQKRKELFVDYPRLRAHYTKRDGELYEVGDTIRDPVLAATLRRIADDPMSYYNGSLADDIIADLMEGDSIITREDLSSYHVQWRAPVRTSMRHQPLEVLGVPPPGSGAIVQYVLNILDGYDMSRDVTSHLDTHTTAVHRFIEALKFGYARRTELSDPDYYDMTKLLSELTSRSYADSTRANITDSTTHNVSYYNPSYLLPQQQGTSHVSILTEDNECVAVTSTINGPFGSLVRGRRTGILFNNEMDDFSKPKYDNSFDLPPSPRNLISPGKRPVSSMTPLIMRDKQTGHVTHAIGGAGGTQITTQVLHTLFRHLWLGDNIRQAVDENRVHHQLEPNHVEHEQQYRQDILEKLHQDKGHELKSTGNIAVVNAIHNVCAYSNSDELVGNSDKDRSKCLHAVSDGRKGGIPDGY